MGSYSRTGYLAIIAESSENVAVKPTTFIPLMSEDIVTQWGVTPATPIAGNRSLNIRAIKKSIEAPAGTLNLLVEPKTIGHFLKGVFGSVTVGNYMPMTGASGDWAVGDTVTGGSSSQTATVVLVSEELDYLLVTSPSGDFTDGETITNGSTGTATMTEFDSTVYGHNFTAPQSSLPTYTIEIGFDNEAYRYTGVRFNSFNPVAQSDNIITAAIGITARAEFKMARITAVTTSGAGSKDLTVDQTKGLVPGGGDTIKLYRPGTGFLDFSAASTKTHTVNSTTGENTINVTNLETATAVGDYIVLAPQTPSYTVDSEFFWIGGSIANVDDDITTAIANSGACIENFEINLTNEIEGRHCANGTNEADRFPGTNFLKGLTGTMQLTRTYTDMIYLGRLRENQQTAVQVKHTGSQIGSTGIEYMLDWRMPDGRFDAFNPSLSEDDLLNQEMPLNMYYSSGDGYTMKCLLVNDIASY